MGSKSRKFGFKEIFKGSLKDPFLYLGIIIFFGLIIFSFSQPKYTDPIDKNTGFNSLFLEQRDNAETGGLGLYLTQENSLISSCPQVTVEPKVLGALIGGEDIEGDSEIKEYEVQSGDSLIAIAKRFDISLDTLLWANDLSTRSKIKPGQKLVILPVSGVIHHVVRGDTISEIAKIYKAEVEDVITFNQLSNEDDIYIGDIIIVPDGTMPAKAAPSPTTVPLASSYFIRPTNGKVTQWLHWYNAIDFGNDCGTPIYAAAQGTVQKVRYGYNRGVGNYLTILHPNGVVTLYGHLLTILVSPEEQVSQGQIIALMGGKPGTPGAGNSTGCHLHFEVRGAKNPFAYY